MKRFSARRKMAGDFGAILIGSIIIGMIPLAFAPNPAHAARTEIRTFNEGPRPLYSAARKGLYAIGTAEASGDLITIINGNIHVAFPVDKKTIKIENSVKTIAKTLTYVNVHLWTEVPILQDLGGKGLDSRDSIHTLVNATLKKLGYELSGMFPILMKGRFASVDFHLGPETKPIKFSDKNISGFIFGFFHRTGDEPPFKSTTILHFVSEDGKRSGFVDAVKILGRDKVTLFMAK